MKKLSISLSGHRTSIALEPEFISALREIAASRNQSVTSIIAMIDATRTPGTNLTSAIRVWVLRNI